MSTACEQALAELLQEKKMGWFYAGVIYRYYGYGNIVCRDAVYHTGVSAQEAVA